MGIVGIGEYWHHVGTYSRPRRPAGGHSLRTTSDLLAQRDNPAGQTLHPNGLAPFSSVSTITDLITLLPGGAGSEPKTAPPSANRSMTA